MKKIDLHIHTVATKSDAFFEFSFPRLKEYVETKDLDAIAITNHNIFDRDNYDLIKSGLEIVVFPGIEVNLEGGHILVIANDSDAASFSKFEESCKEVENKITTPETSLSKEDFFEIFGDVAGYILIPHYEKEPRIPQDALESLGRNITAGEVSSPKKFIQAIKDSRADSLVPVLFSDCRLDECSQIPNRQTFVDLGEVSFGAIKNALCNKNAVALSSMGRGFIDYDNGRIKISTGLNVVLGARSSGKTFTLKTICQSYGVEKVKYIKQFSLLKTDEHEDKKEFDEMLSEKSIGYFEDYIGEFKKVVNSILELPRESEEDKSIEKYIQSLKSFASSEEKKDAFSRCVLFNETNFATVSIEEIIDLIKSTLRLIENKTYNSIIAQYIRRENLIELARKLVAEYHKLQSLNNKRSWVNEVIEPIREELQYSSSVDPIHYIDLRQIAENRIKRSKFVDICSELKKEKVLVKKRVGKFLIEGESKLMKGAYDLSNISKRKLQHRLAYDHYDSPLRYLYELQDLMSIPSSELYKYFIRIKYRVLNEGGFEVSGGERAEFNLLQQIQDARRFDILLIDEPESSFDNLFLKDYVNVLLRELSKEMPVVVVTHNNTVGSSILPNFVLFTTKSVVGDETQFKVFYGHPSDAELKSSDGDVVANYEIQMNSLEAGKEAYYKRSRNYESLKN